MCIQKPAEVHEKVAPLELLGPGHTVQRRYHQETGPVELRLRFGPTQKRRSLTKVRQKPQTSQYNSAKLQRRRDHQYLACFSCTSVFFMYFAIYKS